MSFIGNRIQDQFERTALPLVEAARHLPTAVIGDVSNRLYSFHGGYQNYSRKALTFAGPAFTVRVRPGDNLFLHKVLDIALPGDVVVCDAGGALDNAILGEMMGSYAASRGIAAIVINGAIRDVAGLAALDIPVYARGVTPNGPWKSGPGEGGYPVSAGGLSISSGDLVVGDADGVIVLPRADAAAVLDKARAHHEVEARWAEQIKQGTWPRGWVDQAIAQLG
ncbi:MAG: RraA family protein [Comamonadaceae bacterium]|nr:MAG: RraA family protein [Comamonadaceae bacterium]